MNKELLKQFYQQEQVRDEVFAYLGATLDQLALAKLHKGEPVTGIKEAIDCLKKAESSLTVMFHEKQQTKDPRRAE